MAWAEGTLWWAWLRVLMVLTVEIHNEVSVADMHFLPGRAAPGGPMLGGWGGPIARCHRPFSRPKKRCGYNAANACHLHTLHRMSRPWRGYTGETR